ncbi:GIT2 [Cordylochernes scorpioides]|uniref:GIT2 n=1 Tax=Cordylochernes scorpioides TaxID=51811 RepID=A0ABY6KKZ5_9ARAC|nr:GIT2 [Cordylochernes scorpioides]
MSVTHHVKAKKTCCSDDLTNCLNHSTFNRPPFCHCVVSDPSWASVNRGILICDECCSVHRSLGRHISMVKSLRRGAWCPTQLAMVHTLSNNGANTIWEHTLLDSSHSKGSGGANGGAIRRKPGPKDLLHPTKADFIRAKHQNLSFLHRPGKDSGPLVEDDLHKQLHSSVRTANVETSLRLLTQGADPNYFHPEKGNTPLHIAAKSGQFSQAELLVVYGADPAAPDSAGRSSADLARECGNTDLADRLVECQYELSDRLTFYLCGRKPDHRTGVHYIIPEMADSLDLSELAIEARQRLRALSNKHFEELAMDLYDEVDRREIDAIWLSTQNQSALVADRQTVPFLPVNRDFCTTRNQGRQKLARFNAREFATLIIDVLTEVKRRSSPQSLRPRPQHRPSHRVTQSDDDEPLYDSVASDEDEADSRSKKRTDSVSVADFVRVKEKLESQISLLLQDNMGLKQEMALLHDMVQKLKTENTGLKVAAANTPAPVVPSLPNGHSPTRPQSMFEPRARAPPLLPRDDSGLGQTQSSHSSRTSGEYDNTPAPGPGFGSCPGVVCCGRSCQQSRSGSLSPLAEHLPSQQDVIRKTEQITKKIQDLLISAQEGNHTRFVVLDCVLQNLGYFIPCSEKIYLAVLEMSSIFPQYWQALVDESVQVALRQLTGSAFRLQSECKSLLCRQLNLSADPQFITQQVIQCAYDIAKAAKQLVTLFQ